MPVPVPNNHARARALNFLPQACAGFAEPWSYLQYKELKPSYGKDGSQVLVKKRG